MAPLKEAKSQLIAFNASAFPYRGLVPETNKPFLDVRDGKRRGHTSLRGDVYWEEPTYSDRRSLLYLPAGFNPGLPFLIVLYLHGQGATLERDVMGRQGVPRQIAAYLSREETDASLVRIGGALGGRDHSTIIHGCAKIEREMGYDAELRREVALLREALLRLGQGSASRQ